MNVVAVESALALCGVVLFIVGLYGGFGAGSLLLAAVGLAIAAVALIAVFWQVRRSLGVPHLSVVIAAVLGALLHFYEQVSKSSAASVGAFAWALLPYLACLGASSVAALRLAALGGAIVALVVDLVVHYQVFIQPRASTAPLALLYAPLWSTLLFAPLGVVATWLFLHARSRARAL